VIAFTHDPEVLALAQAAVDPNPLTIHELGSGGRGRPETFLSL
jgi:hypothetical protein